MANEKEKFKEDFYDVTFQAVKLNELISSHLVDHLDTDLTKIQIGLLIEIHANQPMSVKELSDHMNMNYGNTSRQCKILEEKKYITRNRDAEDERFVQLYIDENGKQMIEKTNQWREDFFTKISDKFTDEDWSILLQQIHQIKNLIEEAFDALEGE